MAPGLYVYGIAVIHLRAAIPVGNSQFGKPGQHIKAGKDAAIALDSGYIVLYLGDKLGIKTGFKHIYLLLRPKYLFLVFLQFGGDVSFRIDKGLFPYPVLRHLVLVRITHFEIIAEDGIVVDFQGSDARTFHFPLLDVQQYVLAVMCKIPQGIKLFVESGGNHISFSYRSGRIGIHCPGQVIKQFGASVKGRHHPVQRSHSPA